MHIYGLFFVKFAHAINMGGLLKNMRRASGDVLGVQMTMGMAWGAAQVSACRETAGMWRHDGGRVAGGRCRALSGQVRWHLGQCRENEPLFNGAQAKAALHR